MNKPFGDNKVADDLSDNIDVQLKTLWEKVGIIVHLSQMIEYNLANILAFDKILNEFEDKNSMSVYEFNSFASEANKLYNRLAKCPMGAGIKEAENIEFFTPESQKELSQICEKRNFVVHKLFKEDLKLKKLDTDPSFYFDRLETLIEEMKNANDSLCSIFKKQKDEYKLIW